jgi:HNH endonuclease
MKDCYVYLHKRLDNDVVFYIGKGSGCRSKRNNHRNSEWNNIVEIAGGYTIEYLKENLTSKDATDLENWYLDNPDISWQLVNKRNSQSVKDLNQYYEILNEYFLYEESSPSCLVYRKTSLNNKCKAGTPAGSLNNGYYSIKIKNKTFSVHRIIYLLKHGKIDNTKVIDHINNISTDNRIVNLREVSHRENSLNRKKSLNTVSGIVGVQYRKNKVGNEYFQASFFDENGKPCVKLFSIDKMGREKALEEASNYRNLKMNKTGV